MDSTVIGRSRLEVRGGTLEIVGAKSTRITIGTDPCTIGRTAGCTIVLDDKQVSKVHAELIATDLGVHLRDLDSRNGTFLGEHRVHDAYLTKPALIRCGDTKLSFTPKRPEEHVATVRNQFGRLVGSTPEMRAIFDKLALIAPTDISVLIGGETGTGKELVAQAIHDASTRAKGPFVVIDCGAIPASLAESTLFGHERGSFTGAVEKRISPFVEATGGTVFLDELGELPLEVQPKLLRALADQRIKSVGSNTYRQVDVRILAATRRELRKEVNAGSFRSDLLFRIAQVSVELPPLRRRMADLQVLVKRIVAELADESASSRLTEAFLDRLARHDWPGNVRELRSVVNVALAVSKGGPIEGMPDLIQLGGAASLDESLLLRTIAELERDVISPIWREYFAKLHVETKGNVSEIARRAAVSRPTARAMLRKYGIGSDRD